MHNHRAKGEHWASHAFCTLKACDTLPSSRPPLLDLLKHLYELMTKYPNSWTYGTILIQTTTLHYIVLAIRQTHGQTEATSQQSDMFSASSWGTQQQDTSFLVAQEATESLLGLSLWTCSMVPVTYPFVHASQSPIKASFSLHPSFLPLSIPSPNRAPMWDLLCGMILFGPTV